MTRLLAENRGRLSAFSDEGGELFQLMGRYAKGGKANLGVYLNGWDNKPHISDRATKEEERIERTTLVVVLAVQGIIVNDLGRAGRTAVVDCSTGTCGRSRPAWSATGQLSDRPFRPNSPRRGPLVTNLARQAEETDTPHVLNLSPGAVGLFNAFQAAHEPRLLPATGDLATVAGWGSKLPSQVGRLAAVLHVAVNGWR